MNIRFKVWIFIPLAFLVLAGCSRGGSPVPAKTEAPSSLVASQPPAVTAENLETTAYPVPQATQSVDAGAQAGTAYPDPNQYAYESPTLPSYPVPRSGTDFYTPVPFLVPEPSAGNGVIVGTMIDSNTGEPMKFVQVYLGKRTYLTPGPGYTYTLQENSSPHTKSDENGRFAIGEITPGSYILMIFTPRSASVVMEPNTDRERDIIIEAGKTLELGEVEAVPPTF